MFFVEKVSTCLQIISSRFPRVGPGDIVTLVSIPVTLELLGFEANLVCVKETRTSIYFISVLGGGHGL